MAAKAEEGIGGDGAQLGGEWGPVRMGLSWRQGEGTVVRSALDDGRVGRLVGSDGGEGARYGRCREHGTPGEVIRPSRH